jgi:hypothetical protein
MTFAPDFSINAEMRVRVNGQEAFVPLAVGTVREAMNSAPGVTTVPKTLMVRRLFQGHLVPVKFDPASQHILDLVLLPGDKITWQ